MSEVKDPKIKLFGKTIQLPEAAEKTGEAAQLCDAAGDDTSINQDPPCSSSSMIEENDINGDGEDHESNKVFILN